MVFEFILFYKQLNLASFTLKKGEKVIQQTGLTFIKTVKIFEYEKNNNEYLDRTKLHK